MMKRNKILALLLACLLVAGMLVGCGASAKSADMAADVVYAETSAAAAPENNTKAEVDEYEMETAVEEAEDVLTTVGYSDDAEAGGSASVTQTASISAKIIYSADLSIQTTEFDRSVSALERYVKDFGGFVESSDTSGNISYESDGSTNIVDRWAYYTVRIPAEKFEEFLNLSGGLGNVINSSRYAENVTSRYTDNEARLSSLRTQEERLLSMLEKSEDVESLIALEERLADVRYETESIERTLRNLDMQISYSTVSITLNEVEKYTPSVPVKRTFGEKLVSSLKNGWDNFADGIKYMILDLAYGLPGLILFLVIAAACVIVLVKLRRKYKAKKAAKAKQAADAQQQEKPEE